MKRYAVLPLLMVFVLGAVQAQDIMNLRMNRNELGLRGNVESVDEDNLYKKEYFRDDWPTRKWFRTDLRQFLQEEGGHIYTFTSAGNIERVTYTFRGKEVASTKCSYHKNGLPTSFLGEGYKIEGKYHGDAGDLNVYAEEQRYHDLGDFTRAVSSERYKTSYPFAYKCRQQLNDKGQVVKSSYYYVDSTLAREVEYTYTFDGRVARQLCREYSDDAIEPKVSTINYTYDGRGLLTQKQERSDAVNNTYTYTNNAMGDCVEMQAEYPYGSETYTYEYEYDDDGNWVMRLTFKDGVFEYATLRTLTYGKPVKEKPVVTDEEETPRVSKKQARAKEDTEVVNKKEQRNQKKADEAAMKKQAKQMAKEAKMTAKEKAKEQEKADKKAAKKAKKAAVKQAKADAKAARKEAEKEAAAQAKADKKAAAKAQKQAQKDAKAAAKEQEKAAKQAATDRAKQAKKDAAAAEKERVQQAKIAAKEQKKATEQAAKEAEKLAKQQAKEEAKLQERAAKEQAKAEAKAAKEAAKAAEKAAKQAAKEAQKQAVQEAKQKE